MGYSVTSTTTTSTQDSSYDTPSRAKMTPRSCSDRTATRVARPDRLYYYGRRLYSPGLGKWINRDPIGEMGGVNLYTVVGNEPVEGCDPFGLDDLAIEWEAWPEWVRPIYQESPSISEDLYTLSWVRTRRRSGTFTDSTMMHYYITAQVWYWDNTACACMTEFDTGKEYKRTLYEQTESDILELTRDPHTVALLQAYRRLGKTSDWISGGKLAWQLVKAPATLGTSVVIEEGIGQIVFELGDTLANATAGWGNAVMRRYPRYYTIELGWWYAKMDRKHIGPRKTDISREWCERLGTRYISNRSTSLTSYE